MECNQRIVTDEDIVAHYQRDPQGAGETLVRHFKKHLEMLVTIALRGMPSWSIDELLSVGYEELIKAAMQYNPKAGAKFKTFIYKRVIGGMRNYIKEQTRHLPPSPKPDEQEKEEPDPGLTPEQQMLKEALIEDVRKVVSQLNPRRRLAITLLLEGRSYKEIAMQLKCGLQIVKNEISRAKEDLKRILLEEGYGSTLDG